MGPTRIETPVSATRVRHHGRLFTVFALFAALTILSRVLLVAPPEQRAEATDDGRFATVWEAWRTLGDEIAPDDSETSTAAARAVRQMAIVANEDPVSLSDRLPTVSSPTPPSVPEGLQDVWRAWRLLKVDYADLSTESLARAAITGLGADSDPALRYLSPDEFEDILDYFDGDTYEGIGAFVTESKRGPMIDEVFIGEPADKAGLVEGDVILSVDGKSTVGLELGRVIEIVKGPPGSEVELLILSEGETAPRTLVITRATVPGPSLRSEILDGEIGYIWLFRFHRESGDEFHKKLQSLIDQGVRGLVLDMRGNPGGSLGSAAQIASEFLSDGIVMYEISNNGEREDWAVRDGGLSPELPLVVIVSGGSASAAEVVAGALQAHRRARLFGSTTYGKGSVQTFRQLSDGSALYLTIARWYTPDGQVIQGRGIAPDVSIPVLRRSPTDVPLIVAYTELLEMVDSVRE